MGCQWNFLSKALQRRRLLSRGSRKAMFFFSSADCSQLRRGGAIAGISCGLPVIAYAGRETAPPVTEAGVILFPEGQEIELGPLLTRVLGDINYRASLASRRRAAHELYFSWNQIVCDHLKTLALSTSDPSGHSSR